MTAPAKVALRRREIAELVALLGVVADLCVNSNTVITTNLRFMGVDYDAGWDLRVDAKRLAERLSAAARAAAKTP